MLLVAGARDRFLCECDDQRGFSPHNIQMPPRAIQAVANVVTSAAMCTAEFGRATDGAGGGKLLHFADG